MTTSLAIALCALAASTGAQDATDDREASLAVWTKIHEVFSHPRCVNCHVPDDNRPRWSGKHYDGAEYHGMNVNGGASRIGAQTMLCSTCHGQENSDVPHGPPGSHVWALAPVQMVWWEKTSQEICEQVRDPARNGGRTIERVAEHILEDHLVHWGWDPGPGREPAPYSPEELVEFVRVWGETGAHCPDG